MSESNPCWLPAAPPAATSQRDSARIAESPSCSTIASAPTAASHCDRPLEVLMRCPFPVAAGRQPPLFLAACNFTLAADITPPPDYVPPTPMPTLGALHPAAAPEVQKGAPSSRNTARPATVPHGPRRWTAEHAAARLRPGHRVAGGGSRRGACGVVQDRHPGQSGSLHAAVRRFAERPGSLECRCLCHVACTRRRSSWNAASRWSRQTAPQCATAFADLTRMAALSDDNLVQLIRNGDGDVPAFAPATRMRMHSPRPPICAP